MVTSADLASTEQRNEAQQSCVPACPLCNGHLIELRGLLNCTRCHFSICEGCGCGVADGGGMD
jgi:hypothetical protein